jgi:Predicted ATPase
MKLLSSSSPVRRPPIQPSTNRAERGRGCRALRAPRRLASGDRLAAARTKPLPPAALLSRLGNRLELLTGGRRDAPPHQQTLRMTLDWSYDLLDPEAQRLFAQLGVFAGGWTLPSAEAVCSGDSSVLEGLAALVDESLVRQRQTSDGEPRFSMLQIVREYALERLAELGEDRRHAPSPPRALRELCRGGRTEAGRPRPDLLVRPPRRRTQQSPRRAAFALETGDSVSALRLVVGIRRFWQIHGYLAEGRTALESALAAASEEPSELRASALTWLGSSPASRESSKRRVRGSRQPSQTRVPAGRRG